MTKLQINQRLSALIMVLFLSFGTAWAQQSLTVYDGSTVYDKYPLNGDWVGFYFENEFVMRASDLSPMADGFISEMKFYADCKKKSYGKAIFQVFMTEIDDTSISKYHGPDNATIVYQGPLSIENSVLNVVFTKNYYYKGGNLLIGIYEIEEGKRPVNPGAFYAQVMEQNTGLVGGYYFSPKKSDRKSYASKRLPKTTFTYKLKSGDITAGVNIEGAGNVTGGGKYEGGSTCKLTAVANEGYVFAYWAEGDTILSQESSLSFVVRGNRIITACFFANGEITVIVNPKGSGNVQGIGSYKGGSRCDLKAVANDGYAFLNWTYDDGTLVPVTSPELTIEAVNGNCNYVANFVKEVKGDEVVKFDSNGHLTEFQKTAVDGTIYYGKYIEQKGDYVTWEFTITNKNGDWYHGYTKWEGPWSHKEDDYYKDIESGRKTWRNPSKTMWGRIEADYSDDNYKTDKDAYMKFYMCQGNDVNKIFNFFLDAGSEFAYIKAAELNSERLIIISDGWRYLGKYRWDLNNTYLNTHKTDFKFYPYIDQNTPLRMLHKTLKDGQILVRFNQGYSISNYNDETPRAEIFYPDGRKYVGNISYNNLTSKEFYKMTELDISFWDTITTINNIEFYRGNLTYPDGKTETYKKEEDLKTVVEPTGDITVYNWSSNTVNAYKTAQEQARAQGLKERAEQEAREAKEREEAAIKQRKEFNTKYGKQYVDALYRGELVIGMHEDLVAVGVYLGLFNNITSIKLDHESARGKCLKIYGYRAYEGSTKITLSGSSLIGWVWIRDGKVLSIDWL